MEGVTLASVWSDVPSWVLFRNRAEKSSSTDVHLTPSQKFGVVEQSTYMKLSGGRVVANLKGSDNMKHVDAGDFIIHLRSFQGGIEHSSIPGKVSNAYTVMDSRPDLSESYYAWLLKSDIFIELLAAQTDQLRDGQTINFNRFARLRLPLPDRETQRRIADYLDSETAQIDTMMAKLDEQVVLLRERKVGLLNDVFSISDTTSRTVNTFSWFGSLPSGWKTTRVGLVGKPVKIKNSGMLEDNLLSLSYGRIVRRDIRNKEGLVPESYETYQIVSPGDVVMRFTDLQNDQKSLRSGLVMEKGILTSAYLTIRPNPELIDSTFFAAVMRLVDLRKIFYRMGSGVRQSLNYDEFSSLEVPLPPLDEQRRIVAELDDKTARIDTMIAKCEELKTLLQERRAALITAVVTGHKEVPSHV